MPFPLKFITQNLRPTSSFFVLSYLIFFYLYVLFPSDLRIYENNPPQHPVAGQLHRAVLEHSLSKSLLLRLIDSRDRHRLIDLDIRNNSDNTF